MSSLARLIPAILMLGCMSCEKKQPAVAGNAETPAPAPAPEAVKPAPQNPAEWRNHPLLKGRFMKENPDDLQVFVHDGGPRMTQVTPELIWVQVSSRGERDIFKGIVLNKPFHLTKVKEGDIINFTIKPGWKQPVQLRENYLRERAAWSIGACDKCGFDELFDAPSELLPIILPNVPPGAALEGFTTFCPMCGGVQMVKPGNK